MPTTAVATAIFLMAPGRLYLNSDRMPLEEVGDAYHIFSSKLDNSIKTVLVPPGSVH